MNRNKTIFAVTDKLAKKFISENFAEYNVISTEFHAFNGVIPAYHIMNEDGDQIAVIAVDQAAYYNAEQLQRIDFFPTIEDLRNDGELIETRQDGTVQLWIFGGKKFVVLADNTVITFEQDQDGEESFF